MTAATLPLAARLEQGAVLRLPAQVTHARRGAIRHAFGYAVEFLRMDPDHARSQPLFSRNGFNLASLRDRDHGGPRGKGRGVVWAREIFAQAGLDCTGLTVALLAQPRFLGFWFNPVSFWLALDGPHLRAVIAEVNNTFGDRHSYLCHLPGFAPITPQDDLTATKVFHVSPFQDISGTYHFRFTLGDRRIAIRILQIDGTEGLIAAMSGPVLPLRTRDLAASLVRRPGGALRVVALIYWNALRLKLKGAAYRKRPAPPDHEVSS